MKNAKDIPKLLEENNFELLASSLRINIISYFNKEHKEFKGSSLFNKPLIITKQKSKIVLLYDKEQVEYQKKALEVKDSEVLVSNVRTETTEASNHNMMEVLAVMCELCKESHTLFDSIRLSCGHFVDKKCLETYYYQLTIA